MGVPSDEVIETLFAVSRQAHYIPRPGEADRDRSGHRIHMDDIECSRVAEEGMDRRTSLGEIQADKGGSTSRTATYLDRVSRSLVAFWSLRGEQQVTFGVHLVGGDDVDLQVEDVQDVEPVVFDERSVQVELASPLVIVEEQPAFGVDEVSLAWRNARKVLSFFKF